MRDPKKRLRLADAAEAAGVSVATVSRVLNATGNVNPQTEQKVRGVLTEMGFEVAGEKPGVGGGGGANRSLVLIVLGPMRRERDRVGDELKASLLQCTSEAGYRLEMRHVPDLSTLSAAEAMAGAAGAFIRLSNRVDLEVEAAAWVRGVPAVRIMGRSGVGRSWIDHVTPDAEVLGAIAADYLIDAGCERLVFATTSPHQNTARMRAVAFGRRAAARGHRPEFVLREEAGSSDGLVADLTASGAPVHEAADRHAFHARIRASGGATFGLFMPRDLELAMTLPALPPGRGQPAGEPGRGVVAIGCDNDDRSEGGFGFETPAATMSLNLDTVARIAVRQLLQRLDEPRSPILRIQVSPELIAPRRAATPRATRGPAARTAVSS